MTIPSDTNGKPVPAQGSDGRFKSGNIGGPGRPVGARNKLSEAFLSALATDFEQHGADAIERVRTNEPAAYVRIVASLMPKKLELEPADIATLSDAQLEAIATGTAGRG